MPTPTTTTILMGMGDPTSIWEAQVLFARLLPRLIDRAFDAGFFVSVGECWRHPAAVDYLVKYKLGTRTSLHQDKLAVDLNLFTAERDYLYTTEDHRPLGEWWETAHPLCRWGGRFRRADGNHYSLTWGGRA